MVSYDGTKITIDGEGAFGSPYYYNADTWAADQAGGWGQFTRLNIYQYYQNCPIIIKGNSYVIMENSQLTINTAASGFAIRVESGYLGCGFTSDPANYVTAGGNSIIYMSTGQAYILWNDDTNGELDLYGCHIRNKGNNLGIIYCTKGKLWNNWLEGAYFVGGGSNVHNHNNVVFNAYRGYSAFHPGLITCADKLLNLGYWPITPGTSQIGARYTDLYCRDYESLVNIQDQFSGTDEKTIYVGQRFDVDSWEVNVRYWVTGNPKVIREHTFDLNVVDQNGNPLSGVSVGLYDVDGNCVFETLTNGAGDISQQIVQRSYVQKNWADGAYGSDIKKNLETDPTKDYGPFKLHVEKSGYFNRYIPGIPLSGDFAGQYQLPHAITVAGRSSKGFIRANQCLKYCGDTGYIKMIDCPARRAR